MIIDARNLFNQKRAAHRGALRMLEGRHGEGFYCPELYQKYYQDRYAREERLNELVMDALLS